MSNLVFPGITGGTSRIYTGHYPLMRSTEFKNGLIRFYNGMEQRWKNNAGQAMFTLQYDDLHPNDKDALDNFTYQTQGTVGYFQFNLNNGLNQIWSYPYCQFLEDSFTWTQNHEGYWNGTIRFRQFGSGGLPNLGIDPRSFPGVGANQNAFAGFPYSIKDAWLVSREDADFSLRTAYAYTGRFFFPSRPLRSWLYQFDALSNLDAARIESHFVACGGSYLTFPWTDPDTGKFYTTVRYDMDALEITHQGVNLNSLKIGLTEVFMNGWVA